MSRSDEAGGNNRLRRLCWSFGTGLLNEFLFFFILLGHPDSHGGKNALFGNYIIL